MLVAESPIGVERNGFPFRDLARCPASETIPLRRSGSSAFRNRNQRVQCSGRPAGGMSGSQGGRAGRRGRMTRRKDDG